MKAKYIDPFTDFGFKRLFGEEASKPLLIDFLGCLLPGANIADITFIDKEHQGRVEDGRKAVYDIYCESGTGEKIIIELQKVKQNYFKDRTIYYSTFPIQKQGEKGYSDFKLKAVYCVGILDFMFESRATPGEGEVVHTVQLKDQNNKVFYDKLTFVYLEMPHFAKQEQQLETRLDKWLYFIKHLEDFDTMPTIFKDAIFEQAFAKAELANYTPEELNNYEQSLKEYRDLNNVIDTAFGEGKTEGKTDEKIQIAKSGKAMGLPIKVIAQLTGLSENDLDKL